MVVYSRILLRGLLVVLRQVRLDPQQSSQRLNEDQRIALVPALRHPPRDAQLRRSRRFVSSCLPLHTAASVNGAALDATTTVTTPARHSTTSEAGQ